MNQLLHARKTSLHQYTMPPVIGLTVTDKQYNRIGMENKDVHIKQQNRKPMRKNIKFKTYTENQNQLLCRSDHTPIHSVRDVFKGESSHRGNSYKCQPIPLSALIHPEIKNYLKISYVLSLFKKILMECLEFKIVYENLGALMNFTLESCFLKQNNTIMIQRQSGSHKDNELRNQKQLKWKNIIENNHYNTNNYNPYHTPNIQQTPKFPRTRPSVPALLCQNCSTSSCSPYLTSLQSTQPQLVSTVVQQLTRISKQFNDFNNYYLRIKKKYEHVCDIRYALGLIQSYSMCAKVDFSDDIYWGLYGIYDGVYGWKGKSRKEGDRGVGKQRSKASKYKSSISIPVIRLSQNNTPKSNKIIHLMTHSNKYLHPSPSNSIHHYIDHYKYATNTVNSSLNNNYLCPSYPSNPSHPTTTNASNTSIFLRKKAKTMIPTTPTTPYLRQTQKIMPSIFEPRTTMASQKRNMPFILGLYIPSQYSSKSLRNSLGNHQRMFSCKIAHQFDISFNTNNHNLKSIDSLNNAKNQENRCPNCPGHSSANVSPRVSNQVSTVQLLITQPKSNNKIKQSLASTNWKTSQHQHDEKDMTQLSSFLKNQHSQGNLVGSADIGTGLNSCNRLITFRKNKQSLVQQSLLEQVQSQYQSSQQAEKDIKSKQKHKNAYPSSQTYPQPQIQYQNKISKASIKNTQPQPDSNQNQRIIIKNKWNFDNFLSRNTQISQSFIEYDDKQIKNDKNQIINEQISLDGSNSNGTAKLGKMARVMTQSLLSGTFFNSGSQKEIN